MNTLKTIWRISPTKASTEPQKQHTPARPVTTNNQTQRGLFLLVSTPTDDFMFFVRPWALFRSLSTLHWTLLSPRPSSRTRWSTDGGVLLWRPRGKRMMKPTVSVVFQGKRFHLLIEAGRLIAGRWDRGFFLSRGQGKVEHRKVVMFKTSEVWIHCFPSEVDRDQTMVA